MNKPKGLLFTDVTIGETKNECTRGHWSIRFFISEEATKKLNLRVEKGSGWLKTMHFKEDLTNEVARDMELHIRQ